MNTDWQPGDKAYYLVRPEYVLECYVVSIGQWTVRVKPLRSQWARNVLPKNLFREPPPGVEVR